MYDIDLKNIAKEQELHTREDLRKNVDLVFSDTSFSVT